VPALNPAIPSSCTSDASGECKITTTASAPGTLTLTATYDAASDSPAGPVTFTGAGQKEWVAASVVGPEAQAPTPPAVAPPPAPTPGLLPRTGAGMLLLLLAVICLLAGTVLMVVRRRRAHRPT
jgi:LPXTG-motif cell wall-anchored protein